MSPIALVSFIFVRNLIGVVPLAFSRVLFWGDLMFSEPLSIAVILLIEIVVDPMTLENFVPSKLAILKNVIGINIGITCGTIQI